MNRRNRLSDRETNILHMAQFGLKEGDEYTREQFDLDGRPCLFTYRVGEPFVAIACKPLQWKEQA